MIEEQLFKIGIKLGALKKKIEVKEEKDDGNEESENKEKGQMSLDTLLQLQIDKMNSKTGLLDEIRDLFTVVCDYGSEQNMNVAKFGVTVHKLATKSGNNRYLHIDGVLLSLFFFGCV